MAAKHPSSRRYPPEVKERAVQLVLTSIDHQGERHGVVSRIARQLDIGPETLRHWVRQAEIDRGTAPGITSTERQRISEPEKENRELRSLNGRPRKTLGYLTPSEKFAEVVALTG